MEWKMWKMKIFLLYNFNILQRIIIHYWIDKYSDKIFYTENFSRNQNMKDK